MKMCSTCKIEKPFSDFTKNKSMKDGLHNQCKICHKESKKKYYGLNRDKILKQKKKYKKENKDKISEQNKKYREENKDKISQYHKEYIEKNRDKKSEYKKQHYKENKEHYAAMSVERKARKIRATPSWLTTEHRQEILNLYKLRVILTEQTGVLHHVDHIVPLRSDVVCGLHVPWNLRVIPAEENLSKSNKLLEDILETLDIGQDLE